MFDIVWKSLRNRRFTAMLAVAGIALSVALILTVEKVRRDTHTSFTQTLSGTDLVIGARSGSIQLLLYSVFRIGNATNNISWQSVEEIEQRKKVDWVVPLSLGDSHRGFRVLGTSKAYFSRYRYGRKNPLTLAKGAVFDDVFDAVLGSEVARKLGYSVGQNLVVAHGTGNVGLVEHDKQPFRVSGILQRTGTPVDDTVHVSLAGIEAMHIDWQSGMKVPGKSTSADSIRSMNLQPRAVTALLVGLTSRSAVFSEQRAINQYRAEPLLAILPGVALQELWSLVGVAESALMIVSAFVVIAGLVNLISVLFAGLNERRREMAILRSCGASPHHIFRLLTTESIVLTILGLLIGLVSHVLIVFIAQIWMQQQYGIEVTPGFPKAGDWRLLGIIFVASLFAGLLPAWRAYRQSLSDGMIQKL